MKIRIYTNFILGGWSPKDYNVFLGGSEEGIVNLAEELNKLGHEVEVYHNEQRGNEYFGQDYNGVKYLPREAFKAFEWSDIVIVWKDRDVWQQTIEADTKIHYTAEIDPKGFWDDSFLFDQVDYYVCISDYHKKRTLEENPVLEDNTVVIPLGVYDIYDKKAKKEPGFTLWAQSPERGIDGVIGKWAKIGKSKTFHIYYGFDLFKLYNMANGGAMFWKNDMMCKIEKNKSMFYHGNVYREELEKAYNKADLWMYPLNRGDSELQCLTGIKCQLCYVTPIIIPEGALAQTVKNFIPFKRYKGNQRLDQKKLEENRKHAEKYLWKNVIKKWCALLTV